MAVGIGPTDEGGGGGGAAEGGGGAAAAGASTFGVSAALGAPAKRWRYEQLWQPSL